jgi:hypothetical protein
MKVEAVVDSKEDCMGCKVVAEEVEVGNMEEEDVEDAEYAHCAAEVVAVVEAADGEEGRSMHHQFYRRSS